MNSTPSSSPARTPFWVRGLPVLVLLAMVIVTGCSKSGRIEDHLQRANAFFSSQKYEEAEIEYKNVLRLDPTNQLAVARLGLIYHDQGRLLPGLLFLTRARELDPTNTAVRYRLGYSLLAGQRRDEAREEAAYILDLDPTHDEALMLLAETALTTNEIQEAMQTLGQLPEQARTRAGYHVARGTLHFRSRELEEAENALRQALVIDPKSSAAHAALGNYYWRRGNLQEAERFLRVAADLAPLRSLRRLRYGEFMLETGEVEAGREFVREMTRQTPDYLPAWTLLAEQAFEEQDYAACRELLDAVLDRDRSYFNALLLEGRLLLAQDQPDAAIARLESLNEPFSKVPRVLYTLALAYLVKGDITSALARLDEAAAKDPSRSEVVLLKAQLELREGRHDEAVALLNRFLNYQPRHQQAHLLLATAHRLGGNSGEALRTYQKLAALYPQDPQAPFSMGQVYLVDLKDRARARQAFSLALDLDPTYVPALEQLIEIDLAEGEYQKARERVDKALQQQDPDRREALLHLLRAKIHYVERDYPAARQAAEKALTLQEDLRPAFMLLTRVAIATGRHQEALEKMRAVLEDNPRDQGALLQVGMIQEAMQDHEAARATYQQLLEVNDAFTPALNNLANVEALQFGNLDEARRLARKAADLAPNDPYVADTLGWIRFLQGDLAQALELIERSAAQLPREPEVHYHLGMVHYMRNQPAQARTAFLAAQRLEKEFAGHEEIPSRLELLELTAKTVDAETKARLQQLHQEHPRDPIVLGLLAEVSLREGNRSEAATRFEGLLELDPNNTSILKKLIRLYAEPPLDQPEKAIALAEKARQIDPEDPVIAGQLGRLALAAGDSRRALALLSESTLSQDQDPALLYALARSQYAHGRLDEALATLDKALALQAPFAQEEEASRFLSLLQAHRSAEMRAELAPALTTLLEEQPDHVPALYLTAQLQESRRQFDPAKERYRRILTLDGYENFMLAHRNLALLLVAHTGDSEEAYKHAVQAREAYPDDPQVAKALGIIMQVRQQFERAAQLLSQSARLAPSDGETQYYLGLSLLGLGRKEEGVAALERCVELEKKTALAERARTAIIQAED